MSPALSRACVRAMHVLCRDGRVLRGGRATLFILGELGWSRSSRVLAWPPLIWLVELAYRVVSGQRRFFGRFLFRSG